MAADANQLLLGKILGEIYRLQRKTESPCSASDGTIYGLLNGFEETTQEELERVGFVTKEQVKHAADVLDAVWDDPEKMAAFKGFYDIEKELAAGGVDRMAAMKILTYFKANHSFQDLIAKMDTHGSPGECRTFELDKWSN